MNSRPAKCLWIILHFEMSVRLAVFSTPTNDPIFANISCVCSLTPWASKRVRFDKGQSPAKIKVIYMEIVRPSSNFSCACNVTPWGPLRESEWAKAKNRQWSRRSNTWVCHSWVNAGKVQNSAKAREVKGHMHENGLLFPNFLMHWHGSATNTYLLIAGQIHVWRYF